jgi:hypothetical protein
LKNILIFYLKFSAWGVLGVPQPEDGSTGPSLAYTEAGFQGRITKAQIWGRALDTSSEIQKQVRDCRSEPVLYRSLILNWAGYEVTSGGVERSVPSSCGTRKCQAGYSGPQCQQLEEDKEPPRLEHCSGDLWIIARNGSAIVNFIFLFKFLTINFLKLNRLIGMHLTSLIMSQSLKLWKRMDIVQVQHSYGEIMTSHTLHQMLLEIQRLASSRLLFFQSFVRNSLTHLAVVNHAKIGVLVDSLRFVR